MRKRYLYIASLLLCMAFLFVGCKAEEKSVRKVIPWEMGFLAVGDQGEVLEVTPEGKVTQLDSRNRKDYNLSLIHIFLTLYMILGYNPCLHPFEELLHT